MTEKKKTSTPSGKRKKAGRKSGRTGKVTGRTRAAILFTGAAILLLFLLLLHGIGKSHSVVKPLIDVPLSEEQTEEVVYTQGVDVSNYQGDINFETLQEQGIQFVFIKATEGNAWIDERFKQNWKAASKCSGLRYGAYHFMSFRTSGEEQAANFINTVPKDKDALPPVVDIELYDEFAVTPPSRDHFEATLDPILTALEEEYGKKPIIYTTTHIYSNYISRRYDNPVWIADHSLPAALPDGEPWLFCQYSYEGVLDGYDGEEPCIDLDVFNGSVEELQEL